jgi:hypothetical protein
VPFMGEEMQQSPSRDTSKLSVGKVISFLEAIS